jgi:WD40 repeat protein
MAVLAFVAALTLSEAAAASVTQLPLTTWGGIAVDGAHGHVFVSGGAGTSSLIVLDFNGEIVATITGQGGATGMIVDESSGTLYVALRDNTAISKIDTATLTETSRMSVSPISLPMQLALANGKLWVAHGCGGGSAGIASMNLDGTGIADQSMGVSYCPVLAATATTNLVATGDTGLSPATLNLYDVSTDPPTLVESSWSPGGASDLNQLVFSPDDSRLLSASNNPGAVQSFSASDLSLAATYPLADGGPNSVAITEDGAFIAASAGYAWYDPDIFVFPAGDTTPVRRWDFNSTTKVMVDRGLAFSPNGSKLFAVSTNDATGKLEFRVYSRPTLALLATTTSLSVSSSTVTYGHAVTLKAHVSGARSGRIAFYKTPYSGTRTLIKSVSVNDSGNASISTKPARKTRYAARFEGNDKYDASTSAGRTVSVRARTRVALTGFYARSGRYKLYRAGQNPAVKGTVAPNHAGSSLKFVAQVYYAGAWRSTATATFTISSDGSAYAQLIGPSRGTYRVQTRFGGDADHLGSKSRWAYLKVT